MSYITNAILLFKVGQGVGNKHDKPTEIIVSTLFSMFSVHTL